MAMTFSNSKEYKVLNVGDSRTLEGELNSYAQQGWRMVSVTWNNDMGYYTAVLEK